MTEKSYINNTVCDSFLTDSKIYKNYEIMANGVSLPLVNQYYYFDADGVSPAYRYNGIWICPYDNNAPEQYKLFVYPWDLADPQNVCNDTNAGYNCFGYIYNVKDKNAQVVQKYFYKKNLTRFFKNKFNAYPPYSNSHLYKIAITIWCPEKLNQDLYNNESVEIDFGDKPIIIKFLGNNFNNGQWESFNGSQYNITQDSDGSTILTINKINAKSFISNNKKWFLPIACLWSPSYSNESSYEAVNRSLLNVYAQILNLEFINGEITKLEDPSSNESFRLYYGSNLIWDKPKTLNNCWKKYGIALPCGWNGLYFNGYNNNYTFINPLKALFYNNLNNDIETTISLKNISTNSNWMNINWQSFDIKVNILKAQSNGILIKWNRKILNVINNIENLSGQWENDGSENRAVVGTSIFTIPGINTNIIRDDASLNIITNEIDLLIIRLSPGSEVEIEFIQTQSNGLTYINSDLFPYHLKVPIISDYDGTTKINTYLYNNLLWLNIKNWFSNHAVNSSAFTSGKMFSGSDLDEIILKFPTPNDVQNYSIYSYMSGMNNFEGSKVSLVTLIKDHTDSRITSLNAFFSQAYYLKEIIYTNNVNNDIHPYLCAPFDASFVFNECYSLNTYPSNLINWSDGRKGDNEYGELYNFVLYCFAHSGLVNIPSYNPNNSINDDVDNNTIILGPYSKCMFYNCKNLLTIGPVLDFGLVDPDINNNENHDVSAIFNNCHNLQNVRIKNLNHGNWNFGTDGLSENQKEFHGDLLSLSKTSLIYLLNNVVDLSLHNQYPNYDYLSNVKNSFIRWESQYKNSYIQKPDFELQIISNTEILCKKKYAESNISIANIQYYTAYIPESNNIEYFESSIIITGLEAGDRILWVDNSQIYLTITEDGIYNNLPHTKNSFTGIIVVGQSENNVSTNPSNIKIKLNNGLNLRIPRKNSATITISSNLSLNSDIPNNSDDIDIELYNAINNANNKGWTIIAPFGTFNATQL